MLLVSMVSFIQYQKVYLTDFYVTMHQKIVKFLSNEDKHIIVTEILYPVFVFIYLFIVFPAYYI